MFSKPNPTKKMNLLKMTLNEYQVAALKTAVYPTDKKIIYPALGLCGESGEVADKVKKIIRDNNQEFTADKKEEIIKELGDVLWYVAVMADDLGYDLEEVAAENIAKLASRQKRGVLGGSGDNR
jgi:NTP pyrophosphatase (non-canonical NTP hydrolase)